jgi:peptidoglycan-associated lipoprotein
VPEAGDRGRMTLRSSSAGRGKNRGYRRGGSGARRSEGRQYYKQHEDAVHASKAIGGFAMNWINRKKARQVMVVLCIGILALWGCPKKTEVSAVPEPQQKEMPAAAPTAEATAQPEQKVEAAKPAGEPAGEKAPAASAGMQPVYFDFDQSFIRSEAKEALKANAEWLKAHPQARIRIEGNCDERGTIEYNQALGQRRAASAKKYLTDMGISGHRISLISYGKEKPSCGESAESCWQKNRRDDFTVVSE